MKKGLWGWCLRGEKLLSLKYRWMFFYYELQDQMICYHFFPIMRIPKTSTKGFDWDKVFCKGVGSRSSKVSAIFTGSVGY